MFRPQPRVRLFGITHLECLRRSVDRFLQACQLPPGHGLARRCVEQMRLGERGRDDLELGRRGIGIELQTVGFEAVTHA